MGLLQLKITYENNPFKEGKVEGLQKKALELMKNNEEIPSFIIDWFIHKAHPIINIEKVYINLNVGGKADSNFTFNLHEHLTYAFPKFAKALHSTNSKTFFKRKKENFQVNPTSKLLPLNLIQNHDSLKDLRGSHHVSVSSNKLEFSPSVVDYINRPTEDTNYSNSLRLFNLKKEQSLPIKKIQNDFQEKAVASGGFVPKRFRFRGDEPPFELYGKIDLLKTLQSPKETKVYLTNPRMYTSYNTLMKQRINKKF